MKRGVTTVMRAHARYLHPERHESSPPSGRRRHSVTACALALALLLHAALAPRAETSRDARAAYPVVFAHAVDGSLPAGFHLKASAPAGVIHTVFRFTTPHTAPGQAPEIALCFTNQNRHPRWSKGTFG